MSEVGSAKRHHGLTLTVTGAVLLLFALFLCARIIWEETCLTWQRGPQMVGFSLAHGPGAVLLLAPLLLIVWCIIALISSVVRWVRERVIARPPLCVLAISVCTLVVLTLPPVFWQWVFLGYFARSPQAADLITYAAAEGDVATVRGYLDHHVSIESRNFEGSTSAYTAAVSGSVPVLKLLAERGADLNALNSFGDSPLEAASDSKRMDAIAYLQAHGAKTLAGTSEQHNAAREAITQKQIKELDASH